MGNPAARLTDMHTCPMVTPGLPPVPHVGGPVTGPGVPNVMVGGLPSAVIGNMCTCVGPPDIIAMGSTSVLIGKRFAARLGDNTAHGGLISIGQPTVLIGGPASASAMSISGPQKKWWGKLLAYIGIDAGYDGKINYGNIVIYPNPNDPTYQGKVLGDLLMIENTPTGSGLIASLNNAGGAIIKIGDSQTDGNCCWTGRKPPEIEYNPDRGSIGMQPWETRPPAIGLAHEMIHADHSANGTSPIGTAPNDAKPNPADPANPPQEDLEELHTVGVPPNNTDPYTENKIRSEWPPPQPQRQWY